MTDVTARRAYQQLSQIESAGLLPDHPITAYPGETPCLLSQAYDLAEQNGLTLGSLAKELAWPLPHLRELLGKNQGRPILRLVRPGQGLSARLRHPTSSVVTPDPSLTAEATPPTENETDKVVNRGHRRSSRGA